LKSPLASELKCLKESPESRLKRLLAFDDKIAQDLALHVPLVGCDEVGRGSLIGPVVASAVMWKEIPQNVEKLWGLNDSKKLSPLQRQRLLPYIQDDCWVGIGEASPQEIAEYNIIGASLLAVKRAIEALDCQAPIHLLLDGRDALPDFPTHQQSCVIKGDAQSALIAMASIVAKEHRDTWVKTVATAFPDYGWQRNMGYATKEHREAIQAWGLTPHHRPSFSI
jgi:ribonuclease HII